MPRRFKKYGAKKGGKKRRMGGSSYSKRSKNKKRSMEYASKTIIKQPSGVADALYVKLKYTQLFSLTTGLAGQHTEYVFRGNSLFDPDQTGTGLQPYFFDQWASFFTNYTVFGSTAKLVAYPTNGGSYVGIRYGLVPSLSSTNYNSIEHVMEQPYSRHRTTQINSMSNKPIKQYISTSKMFGLPKIATAVQSEFNPLTTASPSSQWYWHVFMNEISGASSVGAVFEFSIIYYCRFNLRNRPSES